MVFHNQMPLKIFDIHLGAQGMEGIGEIQHILAPLLMQRGPSHVLVVIVTNRVILFLDHIHKKYQVGSTPYIPDFSMEVCSQ
jgi:hypothetical protein